MRTGRKLLVLALLATLGISASAEQRGEIRRVDPGVSAAVRFSAPWRPNGGTDETKVIGTVIDIRQVPVTYAKVQLRDLKSGNILATDDTNELGEYEFLVEQSGTYVVEMVMVDNYVVALSNAGSLSRYSTLQTVIQLPGRWDAMSRSMSMPIAATAFFGLGSASSMTSGTIAQAADNDTRPTDAGEPVSPR